MLGSDRFTFETPNVIDPGDLPPSVPERKNTSDELLFIPGSPPTSQVMITPSSGSNHNHKNGKHLQQQQLHRNKSTKASPSCSNSYNSNTLSTHSEESTSDEDEAAAAAHHSSYDSDHRKRLLDDIRDLDLTPPHHPIPASTSLADSFRHPHNYPPPRPRPYDPYHDDEDSDDDEDDEDEDYPGSGDDEDEDDRYYDYEKGGGGKRSRKIHGSLPSPEEARMHAMLLLADRDVRVASSTSSSIPYRDSPTMTVRLAGDVIADKRKRRFQRGGGGGGNRRGGRSGGAARKERRATSTGTALSTLLAGLCGFCRSHKVVLAAVIVIVTIVLSVTLARRNATHAAGLSSNSTSSSPGFVPQNVEARTQDIVDFLTANGITSSDALSDPSSPQSLAVHWMAAMDTLQVDVPELLHSDQRFVQRYVLAVLFYATDGTHWKERYEFMTPVDECAWYDEVDEPTAAIDTITMGVSCHPRTLSVQGLYLPSNGLKGTLPEEIQFLTDLDLIALPYNDISGRLPSGMAQLTSLNYLDLRYNAIEGNVPDWVGDLTQLQVLGLSSNQLAGSIPPSVGTLASLKSIALSDNALTGSVSFLNHLSALEYVWIDRNSFTGYINDDFLPSHLDLVQIDVSSNKLKCAGVFPLHLLQHSTLQVLNMDDNALNVALPSLPYANFDLQYLSLRRTVLKGSIPTSISKLSVLKHLDLHGNSLTGTVPYQLGQLDTLTYLFLGQNGFERTQDFPPYVSGLAKLEELNLEGMQVGGSLPHWLGSNLPHLRMVDLSHNYLEGSIPSSVWQLRNLTYLLLQDNQLTGTIPQDSTFSNGLSVVSLYQNELTGDASVFCAGKDPDTVPDLVAIDCAVTCESTCCAGDCCSYSTSASTTTNNNGTDDGDDDSDSQCYPGKVATYLSWYADRWDFNYTRDDYAFDPAILIQIGVGTTVDVQDGEQVPVN